MTVFDKINLVFLWFSNNVNTYFWGVWQEILRECSLAKINNIHFHAWETETLDNNRNMLIGGWRNTCMYLVQYTRATAEEQFRLVKLLRLVLSHLVSVPAKSSESWLCKPVLPVTIQILKPVLLLSFMNQYLCLVFSVLLFASLLTSFLLVTSLWYVQIQTYLNMHCKGKSMHLIYEGSIMWFPFVYEYFFSYVKHEISLAGGKNLYFHYTFCYFGLKSHEKGFCQVTTGKNKVWFLLLMPYPRVRR